MDFQLPELGEGVYEAEFVSWLVKVGDPVKRGQSLMEVMTDKATMEVPSPFAGTITALKAEPGQKTSIGDVMLTYEPAEKETATEAPAKSTKKKVKATASTGAKDFAPTDGHAAVSVKAAPSVRLMARQLGVDLARVRGTGPDGRVLIEDLKHAVQPIATPAARPAEPKPDYGKPGTKSKLIGLRRKIAEQMVKSTTTIPHYGYVDECDVTDLVRLRESLKEDTARAGIRLTYLAFFVKAVVAALKEVPLVNSSLDDEAGEIVLHDRYNIGIAVAAPNGLIVPVIKDADKKDLLSIASEIERLSTDARTGKSKRDDLLGGTFTITSIGNIGGLFSTPVINHPEAGILGVGKIVKRPVYDAAGNVIPADMLYISFSFDHRIVDGALGAAFGNAVIEQLGKPARLLVAEKLGG